MRVPAGMPRSIASFSRSIRSEKAILSRVVQPVRYGQAPSRLAFTCVVTELPSLVVTKVPSEESPWNVVTLSICLAPQASEYETLSPATSNDLIVHCPLECFSAFARADVVSPLTSLALSAVTHWVNVRVEPSVVIENSHFPRSIRSAA